jgi:hypothetical protein
MGGVVAGEGGVEAEVGEGVELEGEGEGGVEGEWGCERE